MARQQKYETPTTQLNFRVPTHIVQALDAEAARQNRPRAEIVVEALIDRYGTKPKPRTVFE